MGWGGEGSHWGCWVHLFSLCGVQRRLIKEACGGPNPACAPSQKGTCFSKDASCPSLVGLTCHHCTAKKVLESRSPQPGMCLPRNHDKKPLERCPVHICSSWRGKQPIQTGWKKRMNFQIAPFFSQAPSYCFLCGGHWASGNSLVRQARGTGSQRWRDCSAASTKDGHRWYARCPPCLSRPS